MSHLNIINKYKYEIDDENIFFHPDIPKKKLQNAIKKYADIRNEIPLMLIDDTLFGSAKVGLLLTDKSIYIKDSHEDAASCLLSNIKETALTGLIIPTLKINNNLKIDFSQAKKKSIAIVKNMLDEINGLENENSSSWTNIGIGAGIGALFGGPIGAAVGGAIGASFQNKKSNKNIDSEYLEDSQEKKDNDNIIFIVTLASMMAKMAKADGVIKQSEATQVAELFDELEFSMDDRKIAIKAFTNAKDDDYSIYDYARQYAEISDNDLREFMYGILWKIAIADDEIHKNEEIILQKILKHLDLSEYKFEEYSNIAHKKYEEPQFERNINTLDREYSILGCTSTDSMQEIKRKYRELIAQYHPDKIQSKGLPDSFIKFATEEMQKINFAYDTIKKSRKE